MVTGHMQDGKEDAIRWESLAKGIDTIAIYMGVGNLPYIRQQLLKYGRDEKTPVAVIHWGTVSTKQRTVTGTLATIEEIVRTENIQNPSIILVGKVVTLRETIQWFEQSPTQPIK